MGGMAAFIPSRKDAEVNRIALERVREDKEREVSQGFDGTWVAHPDLVPVAKQVFDLAFGDRPNQIERQRDDLQVTGADLLNIKATPGEITEAGLRNNVSVGIRYLAAWLDGAGAVAIDNLMEDAATAEISRSQIWQWIRHGKVSLEDVKRITAEEVDHLGPGFDAARALFDAGRDPAGVRRVPDDAGVRQPGRPRGVVTGQPGAETAAPGDRPTVCSGLNQLASTSGRGLDPASEERRDRRRGLVEVVPQHAVPAGNRDLLDVRPLGHVDRDPRARAEDDERRARGERRRRTRHLAPGDDDGGRGPAEPVPAVLVALEVQLHLALEDRPGRREHRAVRQASVDRLLWRRIGDVLPYRVRPSRDHGRVDVQRRVEQDGARDQIRMCLGELDCQQPTEAVADPVGALDPERRRGLGEIGDVPGDTPRRLPARVPVTAQVEPDHAPPGQPFRQHLEAPPVARDAVQADERLPGRIPPFVVRETHLERVPRPSANASWCVLAFAMMTA